MLVNVQILIKAVLIEMPEGEKTLYIQAIDLAVIFYHHTLAKPNEIWNNSACRFSLLMAQDWLQV